MERYKTVREKKDLYIEFSEEEMTELGWKENQQLSITVNEDNSIFIKPFVTMELDISNYPKEVLEYLIRLSIEQNISVNDVIIKILETFIKDEEEFNVVKKHCKTTLLCEQNNE
jgi:hypothetical protein